ncbi:NAD-dependent epimerase/dehydratase family protein [Streptomyces sp. NPDC049813]|uniref:NAD-dependent epimerase/dehydratase family protein n=1 Tax=Streptomyces sp. NPDC049813 TaxID=3365597 RepID=UPI0037B4C035
MRLLVLGARGFLGRHVAGRLRALPGVRVLTGGRHPADDLRVDLATVRPGTLAELIGRAAPDAVANCAGAVGGSSLTLVEANSRAPAVLCAALRDAAPAARLVHLGSAAEYGPTALGERTPEEAPARPVCAYGASKLAGTLAVTGSGLDAVVLRVTDAVGPGAGPAQLPGRLTAELREALRHGRTDPLRVGGLAAHRDYVDVRDVATAVALALTAPQPLPPLLNIGSGRAVAVRELAHGLVRASGYRGRVEAAPGADRAPAVPWQCARITAARQVLDWRPTHTLHASLSALWRADGAPGQEPR